MSSTSLTEIQRETLALFEISGEPWTTTEVADHLDLGRRSTYERLERLVDHNRLKTKKVGGSGRVWWRPPADSDTTPDWSATTESLIDDVLDSADVAIFVIDEEFDVAWINDATERYFGLDRNRVLGRDKHRLIEEQIASVVDDGEAFTETVLATYDDNTYVEQFECHVTPDDGEERWLEHRSKPIEAGAYAGGRVELYYDITDRKEMKQAHDRDRIQFESVIDAVEEHAIFMLDPDGYVRTWNQGAERIKGYTTEEILGEHFSRFYTDEARQAGVPQENLTTALEQGSFQDEGWRLRADGSRFWANVTITPIRGDDGEIDGLVKITRDMTERRKNKQGIRRERNLLEKVQEASPIGIAIFDTEGELQRANQRFMELLGRGDAESLNYSLGEQPPLDTDGNVIPYPERPAPRALSTGDAVTDQRIRIDGPDGRARWLSVNAKPFDGETEGVVVTTTEVTQFKEQAQRLERQRDDLQSELEGIFERIDDAFFSLDGDLRFNYVNEQASTLLGHSSSELVGRHIWDVLKPGSKAESAFEEALKTQESISFEEYYEPIGTWFENHVYPSETGLSVYFQDISDRKRRERRLERFERMVETVDDGVYATDGEGHFVFVNDAFVAMSEHTREELLGSHGSAFFGDRFVDTDEQEWLELITDERDSVAFETDIIGPDGETRIVHNQFVALEFDDEVGRVGVTRDVTGRKERERELERYEQLVETVWDGVYALDENDRMVLVNDAFCELVGYERDELLGEQPTLITSDEVNQDANELAPEVIAGDRAIGVLEGELQTADGEVVPVETRHGPFEYEDGRTGRCGVTRDISDRKWFEETLLTLYESTQTLFDVQTAEVVDEAVIEAVADVIDLAGVAVYRYDDADDELYPAAHSMEAEFVRGGDLRTVPPGDSSIVGHVYTSGDVLALDDITESPYHQSNATEMHGGLFVPMGDHGVLVAGTREESGIDENTRRLVELLATNIEAAYNRVEREVALREHEQELEQQREGLTALNNLNEVVRGITDAVIEQSTREEIERTVCERLADSESYLFAWIGDTDTATQTVNLRTEAGVEGYLDGITISVDPDDERSEGPTGRALRTGETQVSHDIRAESRYDPWREYIERYGFRSSAAVPIVHERTVYGVINVYADRPHAFDGEERELISQLGEVVGHAIAATERKQALMSDELVELEFQIQDVFAALNVPVETSGRITLDSAVPVSDGEFLVYGTVAPDAVDTVARITKNVPHWRELTIRSEGDPTRFEVRMTDPPVLSVVASLGGYVEQAVIEDGDLRMTVHLAPSVDARTVTDAVETAYPASELVRRQQISRDRDDPARFQRHLVEALTGRQQTALETAYHAGFFEWPRDTSGEEVAESIGIASPTFHQHLRKAERKVLDAVFSSPMQSLG